MKTLKKWTSQDLNLLRKYSKEGIEKLKKKLPSRSEQAIRTKCCYLNLSIGNVREVTERLYMVV